MNFKHYILDYSKQFKESVIDNFIEEYSNGRTPSPCVRCNQHIKFGELIKFAKKINADLVVTGHYIKHSYSNNKIQLHKAVDSIKDQTYFMSMIPKENANMMRFPLGIFSKAQVREIAEQLDLIVAKKRESQDLCFIQNGNYRIMLRDIGRSGNICDLDGNVLGYHQGLNNYTVGQKKGINLNNGPWYVIKLVASENKVIVGRQEDLEKVSFRIEEINWITDEVPGELKVKVRAQQEAIECTVHNDIVSLCTPALSISPGQICAFYSGTQLVGGATISSQ